MKGIFCYEQSARSLRRAAFWQKFTSICSSKRQIGGIAVTIT